MSQGAFDEEDYSASENDVGLGEEGKAFLQQRQEFLKMTKGQSVRAALLYFHTVDKNAVTRAIAAAKKDGAKLDNAQIKAIARKALEERATALSKTLDQLTVTDRLDTSGCQFKTWWGHYSGENKIGYVISRLGKDGPEGDAVWKKLPDAKRYFSTLLIVYPTNRDGEIDKQRLANDWMLIPWRFGPGIYDKLHKLNHGLAENGMGLHSQDLKLECKDAQYQNIDVSFVGKAVWQQHPKFKEVILSKALPFYDKLISFREITTDQLRAKLGMGGSGATSIGADAAAAGGDYSDLLDQI